MHLTFKAFREANQKSTQNTEEYKCFSYALSVSWTSPANIVFSPMLFSPVCGAQVSPSVVLILHVTFFSLSSPFSSSLFLLFCCFWFWCWFFFSLTFCLMLFLYSLCMAYCFFPRFLIFLSPCFAYTAASWRTTGMYKAQILTGASRRNTPSHPHIIVHYITKCVDLLKWEPCW